MTTSSASDPPTDTANPIAAEPCFRSRSWFKRKIFHRSWQVALGCLAALTTAIPSPAAERVSVSYGPLELSLSVKDLETYAETGRMSNGLAFYARFVDDENLEQLRDLLRQQLDLDAVAISQILYSSFGETSLQQLGELIQTDARQNGFYALRSALILAANDPEGLTPLNIIKHFPTPTVRIQSVRAIQVANEFTQLLHQTDRIRAVMSEQAAADIATDVSVDFARGLNLQEFGTIDWQQETLQLHDRLRNRSIAVDLYTPNLSEAAPVLVISHGIAADRQDFSELAQHLASHGFAVAVLDHPGSDRQHFQNLLRGLTQEIAEPNEFVNRPLDVSYLLDELEQLNQPGAPLHNRLNLQKVGVIGHSLGGYTALALAGAQLNFDLLRRECQSSFIDLNIANLSMPLQCEALRTTLEAQPLQDNRVRAIVAVNSVSHNVFGQEGLRSVQVPVMLIGGSRDVISPVLLEQVCPFTWLTGTDKYLAVIEKGTHVYNYQNTSQNQLFPGEPTNPNPALAHRYLQALSLAFSKVHVAAQPEYRDYLRASYAQSISESPLPLTLLNALNTAPLTRSLVGACPGTSENR
ncbi:alpha/beta hydrolase [Thermocoleostomius sinensis]|uniref:Alpha/beta hydrolase n=1 Tax=Thermocoleostomius sinensis A174 TaxID=2016057 RepID=A0A9E9C5I1_9CYAN|nr:alpha/beta hydrolase [Thermocoleostomius sinensis]WAL58204.1 alpha/beta hydrolase [Thermocoleostomius sinensis A174]